MSVAEHKEAARALVEARRVVIKVGSALLVDPASGRVNRTWLESLAADIERLRKRGQEVMVVSSGAIALGRRHLNLPAGRLQLEESQASAAVGQIRLAHAWKEVLEQRDLPVAQILLTLGDTEQRRRYLNARNTLNALLRLGAVPVINENDTVATTEIRYGDNDRLAARVAQTASADCLVLLSDIDGLYSADPAADPGTGPQPTFISKVLQITPEIEAMAGGASSGVGTGGMATKIMAARIALNAGCSLCIASGRQQSPLEQIEKGARCTWFVASASPLTRRKQWIAATLHPTGALVVDAGAVSALANHKSLLPAGVIRFVGRFERGDTVSVLGPDGKEIAKGICAYSDRDAARIMGRRSAQIESILGFRGRDEMIHRDDLVWLAQTDPFPAEVRPVPQPQNAPSP
jgi:glutamate 5-kinase